MGLRPNILSCIALFLLVHYSYLCLYKGSLLYYIIHIIQYTDFQSLTLKVMTNKVAVDLNMLGTLMEDVIVGNLDGTSIVTMDRNCSRTINA
jgi:hypothetical protein